MIRLLRFERTGKRNLSEKTGKRTDADRKSAGFLTVEAALLMPVILTVILLSVYLSAHVHGRCVLYESAAEQAVSGQKQETAGLFAVSTPVRTEKESRKKREVQYTAGSAYLDNLSFLEISEKAEYRITDPVKEIRKAKAARSVLTDVVQ